MSLRNHSRTECDPVHINDLQATMLKQFGIDHLKLTYRHQGVNMRLTNITREASAIDALIS